MPEPLVVTCAPNGARLGRERHPGVPLTPAELADTACALVDCGVSVLHLHVRDGRGRHSLAVSDYRAALAKIRAAVADALVLQVTTEAAGRYSRAEQMALVTSLRPEAVSLALRELCPDETSEAEAARFFAQLRREGGWPQYILYGPEEVARFERLRRRGVFGEDRPFALFVIGSYDGSVAGDPAGLDAMLAARADAPWPWAACCFGAREAEVARHAARAGGHVRIGFENNLLLPGGMPAADNAELVRAAALERCGRPIATAAWVRDTMSRAWPFTGKS